MKRGEGSAGMASTRLNDLGCWCRSTIIVLVSERGTIVPVKRCGNFPSALSPLPRIGGRPARKCSKPTAFTKFSDLSPARQAVSVGLIMATRSTNVESDEFTMS